MGSFLNVSTSQSEDEKLSYSCASSLWPQHGTVSSTSTRTTTSTSRKEHPATLSPDPTNSQLPMVANIWRLTSPTIRVTESLATPNWSRVRLPPPSTCDPLKEPLRREPGPRHQFRKSSNCTGSFNWCSPSRPSNWCSFSPRSSAVASSTLQCPTSKGSSQLRPSPNLCFKFHASFVASCSRASSRSFFNVLFDFFNLPMSNKAFCFTLFNSLLNFPC